MSFPVKAKKTLISKKFSTFQLFFITFGVHVFSFASSGVSGETAGNYFPNGLETNYPHEQAYERPNYEYVYEVHGGQNYFGHSESREGSYASGSYHVLLPDGRKQIVSYYVDETGYHPTVTYEDVSNHVEELPKQAPVVDYPPQESYEPSPPPPPPPPSFQPQQLQEYIEPSQVYSPPPVENQYEYNPNNAKYVQENNALDGLPGDESTLRAIKAHKSYDYI